MKNTFTKTLLIGLAAGVVASWVKAKAEPPLQKWGEDTFPPSEEELELKGADVSNRPQNMPPAVLANKINFQLTGKELTKEQKIQTMPYIHYTLGALVGATYAFTIAENKKLTYDQGLAAGVVVWGLTHGSTVPALGLQAKVKDMPKSWWVWEFGSHIVFGVAMEQARKLLSKIIK